MATVNYIPEKTQSKGAMKGVIDYCKREDKVRDNISGRRLVSGINCNGENAYLEFMTTKNTHKKENGIFFYQYTQSFSPSEKITPEEVHKIGLEFASRAWPGHEILVTTHCDVQHLHSHFVINSVNFENGYKLRQDPNSLKMLRALSDEICADHGYGVLKPYQKDGTKISSREYRAALKGESWKFRLMSDIDYAMNASGTRDNFVREMEKRGYKMNWSDTRKYLTFTCPDGKKCRDNRLHDNKYLKGSIENEFKIREQIARQFSVGNAETKEQSNDSGHGVDSVSAAGICDTDSAKDVGKRTAENSSRVPAGDLPTDINAGDKERVGELYGKSVAHFGELLGESSSGSAGGEPEISADDPAAYRTGWEESREVYFGMQRNAHTKYQKTGYSDRQSERQNSKNHFNNGGICSNLVGTGMLGLASLASVIEDDSEDKKERKKRMEAKKNSSNLGAAVGIAVGIAAALIKKDDNNSENLIEEQNDEMNMNL